MQVVVYPQASLPLENATVLDIVTQSHASASFCLNKPLTCVAPRSGASGRHSGGAGGSAVGGRPSGSGGHRRGGHGGRDARQQDALARGPVMRPAEQQARRT